MANNNKNRPTENISVSLSSDQIEALNERSSRTDLNVSQLLRRATEFYLLMIDSLTENDDTAWEDYRKRHNLKSC